MTKKSNDFYVERTEKMLNPNHLAITTSANLGRFDSLVIMIRKAALK